VLGPSNQKSPSVSGDVARLEEAWVKMRAAAALKRQHHQHEGTSVLDAFKAIEREREEVGREQSSDGKKSNHKSLAGKVSPAEFKRAWFSLGVRDLSDAQVAGMFQKVGFDAYGQMPYDVFIKQLTLKDSRVLGKELLKKGPFKDPDDARFVGKITYPQCKHAPSTPSDWLKNGYKTAVRSSQLPTLTLNLDFAHGFPGKTDLANSLLLSKHKKLVYFIGALGVVYDPTTHTQRFFRGHTDDVRSVAAHPDGVTFATGQDGQRPSACVWSSEEVRPGHGETTSECAHLATVTDTLGYARSFIALAFSPDGQHLLTVGSDDKHTVFLWDWKKHKVGGNNSGNNGTNQPPLMSFPGIQAAVPAVFGALYNPYRIFVGQDERPTKLKSSQKPFASGIAAFGSVKPVKQKPKQKSFEFVTFGAKHVKLWRVDGDGRWGGRALSFGKHAAFYAHAAVFLPGGGLLVGTDDGSLALFDVDKRQLKRVVKSNAHRNCGTAPSVKRPGTENSKGVRALVLLEDEGCVVSAGADGRLLAWHLTVNQDDIQDTPFEEITLQNPMGEGHAAPMIRSLAVMVEDRTQTGGVSTGRSNESKLSKGDDTNVPSTRAADRPWGVDGDLDAPPQSRFPTKPKGITPWATVDVDSLNESAEDGSVIVTSSTISSTSSSLFSRIKCFTGTTACDLWEVTDTTAKIRIAGACGTLDAVSWNPDYNVCATVGSDGFVRLCDAERRAQTHAKDVGNGVSGKSVSFSPDGNLLAVGFIDGRLVVLHAQTLQVIAETTPVALKRANRTAVPGWSEERNKQVSDRIEALSFSPDSSFLAAAGGDRTVRVYANVSGRFTLVATLCGHSCTIRALDWSDNGQLLRSQCVGGELLHWQLEKDDVGQKDFSFSKSPFTGDVRDITWRTHCSTVGFPVMGVWGLGGAGNDVISACDVSYDSRYLVTGDSSGDAKVFNYPCVVHDAPAKREKAHGSRVGDVKFSSDSKWVATVGTLDKSLMIWRIR
tara:strand:+ start:2157 stop:5144 length:2988 start_codon:yes stop_codon:yes gene_type:complete